MKLCLILLLIFPQAFAQAPKRIQVLPNPQSLEDFEHQNKGCPENSECDQAMGLMFQKWKEVINKVQSDDVADQKKTAELELFRSKFGLPTEFYTNQKSQQGFKPALYSSSCKHHNPKPPGEKILRGMAFIKSLSLEKAVVWRDQNVMEVPTSDLLVPQPVKVYYETPMKYALPLGDQPLLIKDKDLLVLKEEDGFYFMLRVSPNGEWKIENVDLTQLSVWEDRRQNVKCPDDKDKGSDLFENEFCKAIWDADLKKTVVVRMYEGCAI